MCVFVWKEKDKGCACNRIEMIKIPVPDKFNAVLHQVFRLCVCEMDRKGQNEYADGWRELTGLKERAVVCVNAALAWSTNATNELRTEEKNHIPSGFEASCL